MDSHQLRSWIFELYEPLEDERQYIVFDGARGNLLIDAPAFSERALRLIRGAGPASVLLITNRARGGDAARYRDALGVQVAAHEDDADSVPGGADLVLKTGELVRPDARLIRIGDDGDAATVVLGRKAGGVLFCGDLDLVSDAARALAGLQFSAVLSARRPDLARWSGGPRRARRRGPAAQLRRRLVGRSDRRAAHHRCEPTERSCAARRPIPAGAARRRLRAARCRRRRRTPERRLLLG